jgi:hypothetical protein
MKGIAHFSIGVALASCFPAAVESGAGGNPLYFLLGGACGLLPDTLDFRLARFLKKRDVHVRPDPLKPDPQLIADAAALAVNRAHAEGRPVSLFLDTVRLGTDIWQSYAVRFDPAQRRVVAAYGEAIHTDESVVAPAPSKREGSAPLECGVLLEYMATTKIGPFDGSLLEMEPLRDGRVMPKFIPWHRLWSHSLVVAGAVGAVVGLLARDWLAGAVAGGAWAAHALADQLGFLGSCLLYPLRKRRYQGLKWAHSGSTLPNLLAVWLSCAVIFWNLYAASGVPIRGLNLLSYLSYAICLPVGAMLAARRWLREKNPTRR